MIQNMFDTNLWCGFREINIFKSLKNDCFAKSWKKWAKTI